MWSICRKEWSQFFSSLTGYVAMILFLLVNGTVLFILENNVLDNGYASLDEFFGLAPWVLAFLIPAISMRSLSEEFRLGTYETLQTRPVGRWGVVMGKYLALIIILLMVMIPTLTYVATVQSLSNSGLDAGGVTGSYLGLFLLGSVFAAISLFCSGISQNAVVAFLISSCGCVLLYFGFSSVSRLPLFLGKADYYIEMLGIDFHYRSISRGVLDTRDISYFSSMIFLFLFLTVKNLAKR
jgi:ABC-2 type transport system permease protein